MFRSWGKRPPVAGTAADIARTRRSTDWKRLSAGAGTKGPRLHDWCYLELADLEAEPFNSANDGLWTRGLLIRRHIADGDLAFFTTWCPAGTSIETLVAVEGHRWAIEDSFETAKNEFGLDHNESRSWHGWHRHVSLVMLAFAMMAAIRHRANPPPPKKTKRRTPAKTKASHADIDPLVNSGNPPHRHQTRAKPYPTRTYRRMVTLAQSSPSCRSASPLQSKTATVMLIGSHRGRIANTAGDSVLAEFASAVDAVQCAVAAQGALAEANAGASPDRHINFRIGVHVGDVMVKGGDLFGDGVNITARLQTLAAPGGVSVSGAAYDHVRKVLPFKFADLGAQQVKNIEEPVRVYAVNAAKPPMTSNSRKAPDEEKPIALPDKPSIAVLPFQNMSGDPEQDYFADGMVEDIITALSRFTTLFVIARNSSFSYKGRAVDIKQVGRELGVRYVLEGSVRKAAGRLRITGQLIEASSGTHLWAEKFDGALEDVFELQDAVTERVVGAIETSVNQAEINRSRAKPTGNLDAYDYYLRALQQFSLYTRAGSDAAIENAQKAISLDPDYALAKALLSSTYMSRRIRGWGTTGDAAKALAVAREAIAQDS